MYSDNNKSQGSVATHLRCGGLALLQNYCSGERILELVHFWRSYRQNGLIASHALFEVHCPFETQCICQSSKMVRVITNAKFVTTSTCARL